MSVDVHTMTDKEVAELLNRPATQEEKQTLRQNLETYENVSRKLHIKDGWLLLKNLRKEANRQKAMRAAERLEEQTLPIENVQDPTVVNHAYERQLADSFEIYEDD